MVDSRAHKQARTALAGVSLQVWGPLSITGIGEVL